MAIRLLKIKTELKMKTFIDYLHEARTDYDPRDSRYWLLNEIIADMEKEPDHQVHTLEAKAYATMLVQKFLILTLLLLVEIEYQLVWHIVVQ